MSIKLLVLFVQVWVWPSILICFEDDEHDHQVGDRFERFLAVPSVVREPDFGLKGSLLDMLFGKQTAEIL